MTLSESAPANEISAINGPPIIEVHHLTKYFQVGPALNRKDLHAVENVSFNIRRGRIVALVGESGSGKTTTARLIAMLIPPTGGEILFRGQNVLKPVKGGHKINYRAHVQMIFQDPFSSLNPTQTVYYHLSRPLIIHHKAKGRNQIEEGVEELLKIVGVTPPRQFVYLYPHQLSGGQRQRVAIARVLAVDPEIILADEPTSMLDVSIRMGILNLMLELKNARQIGYLYITHDLASARYIGDEIIVMYAGHMVEGAASEELVTHAMHPYTQMLLSAVPNPHAGLTMRRVPEQGNVASLINPPPGCPFAPRCERALPQCRKTMPEINEIEPGHWLRCHLFPVVH
jgi:peptide/nickel transport system ATP-binding protein